METPKPVPLMRMIRLTPSIDKLKRSMLIGWFGLSLWLIGVPPLLGEELESTVELTMGKKTTVGRLMALNRQRATILRRDGRIVEVSRSEIDKMKQVAGFKPYSSQTLQDHYRKMFGEGYEVTRTRYYVIIHPPGMRTDWADPLDQLYHRFEYYFNVRGFTIRPAEFPLVVVVFKTKGEFNRVARKDGIASPSSYAGYYSSESNWIVTYRDTHAGGSWEKNATLIHEALHQFAFNHGIHQRWSATPQWCAEGLAAMFEARGINNARQYNRDKDKLNPVYLRRLKEAIQANQVTGKLKYLIASDRVFEEDMALAYSMAWGLAFYLAETQPAEFNRYLQRIARRDRTSHYPSSDRLADFAISFGRDFSMLESRFTQFVKKLD